MRFLAEKTTLPEPCCLYTAVKVWDPGAAVMNAEALARTESLPATRSELLSEAVAMLLSTSTVMKPKDCPVLPSMFAVTITSTLPEAGTVKVSDGPPRST